MIIEPECSGKTISDVCIAFGVSRETWYKWKRRYDAYGIDELKDQSRKGHMFACHSVCLLKQEMAEFFCALPTFTTQREVCYNPELNRCKRLRFPCFKYI